MLKLLLICPPFHDTYPSPLLKIKKNQPFGNIPVLNSPAAAPHHFSEGSYSAYALFIHD